MGVPFPRPSVAYRWTPAEEAAALDRHFDLRSVPSPEPGRLLVATWNISNLGLQRRSAEALQLIARILRRFDLIAVQELGARFGDLEQILAATKLPFRYVMNDVGADGERLAFVYRADRVELASFVGEVALAPVSYPRRTVEVKYSVRGELRSQRFPDVQFEPFARAPYFASFRAGALRFTLVTAHLFHGKWNDGSEEKERAGYCRRVLEMYALNRWADGVRAHGRRYDRDVMLAGDFNVPRMAKDDAMYRTLCTFGMQPLKYVTRTGGSNLGNDRTYDQMVFAPGGMRRRVRSFGVFDFDNAVFRGLWTRLEGKKWPRGQVVERFNSFVRWHVSDHRPVWVELSV
jgi:endonuclease/exonuclease/phosphatase family metal-dependent hydrolase